MEGEKAVRESGTAPAVFIPDLSGKQCSSSAGDGRRQERTNKDFSVRDNKISRLPAAAHSVIILTPGFLSYIQALRCTRMCRMTRKSLRHHRREKHRY